MVLKTTVSLTIVCQFKFIVLLILILILKFALKRGLKKIIDFPLVYSMLVNVYGSTDLFVSEYRTLLADRLLASFNYDTEKEVGVKSSLTAFRKVRK